MIDLIIKVFNDFKDAFSNILVYTIASILFILFIILILWLFKYLFTRIGWFKNSKFKSWFDKISTYIVGYVLKRATKNEELSKINMELYNTLDEKIDKTKEDKKEEVKLPNIPDSPLVNTDTKEQDEGKDNYLPKGV